MKNELEDKERWTRIMTKNEFVLYSKSYLLYCYEQISELELINRAESLYLDGCSDSAKCVLIVFIESLSEIIGKKYIPMSNCILDSINAENLEAHRIYAVKKVKSVIFCLLNVGKIIDISWDRVQREKKCELSYVYSLVKEIFCAVMYQFGMTKQFVEDYLARLLCEK